MKLFDVFRRTEQRADDPSWNALTDGGTMSASGQHVDSRTAESIAAVYACVAALSESTSTLPLHVYMRTEDGNRRSDRRRVGKECVRTCRSRGCTDHYKKKK